MLTKSDRLAVSTLPGCSDCGMEELGHHGASLAIHADGRTAVTEKG